MCSVNFYKSIFCCPETCLILPNVLISMLKTILSQLYDVYSTKHWIHAGWGCKFNENCIHTFVQRNVLSKENRYFCTVSISEQCKNMCCRSTALLLLYCLFCIKHVFFILSYETLNIMFKFIQVTMSLAIICTVIA